MGEFQPLLLLAVLGLVGLNGFFVAAEFALVSVRRTRIQELTDQGSHPARLVKLALDDINQYVSTAQIGITMSSLGIGFLGEPLFTALLDGPFTAVGLGGDLLHFVSLAAGFAIMTFLHVVVGEVAPKNFALQKAEGVALFSIRIMHPLRLAFSPLIWFLNGCADSLLRIFRVEPAPGLHLIHSEEELKMLVSQSSKGGVLEDSEQEMLYNVFDFADKDVAEVMVPRPDVVSFSVELSVSDLLSAVAEQPFTRFPIHRGDPDDVLGILHIRDLFTEVERSSADAVRVQSLLRPAHVVPESKSLAGLLTDFRRSKSHMALVVDEYGSLAGIVTLEDLIEEIVGEIDDEHDRPDRPIERIGDNHVRVDGKFAIDELNERFGLDLPEDDYHTVGGFVFGLLGQQPHEGDVVRHGTTRMEVVETDGPRIVHVDVLMKAGHEDAVRQPGNDAPSAGDAQHLDRTSGDMLPGEAGPAGAPHD